MFALVHRAMRRVRGSPSKGAVLINEDDLNEDKENYAQARWHANALHLRGDKKRARESMLLKPPMPLRVPLRQGRSSTGPPCYLPSVLLLSCLLLTTLYLMRHNNTQLAAAEGYIRQMKQHVNDLEEEVSSSQLRTKFASGSESGAGMASCPNDLAIIKKQLVTWQAKTEELNQQIEEWKRKSGSSDEQISALQSSKDQLLSQVSNMHHEKRILAKRLGIKMAGERTL